MNKTDEKQPSWFAAFLNVACVFGNRVMQQFPSSPKQTQYHYLSEENMSFKTFMPNEVSPHE